MSFFKKTIIIYAFILVILGVFVLGWAIGSGTVDATIVTGEGQSYGRVTGKSASPPAWLSQDINFSIFWDAWQKIQKNYVDRPIPEKQLLYGALSGMVASLEDPYSNFLEPQVAEEFAETLAGRFEGIGAEIGIKNDLLTIISPLPDSPAEQSGLKGGDKVYKIDDFDTTDITLDDAVSRIRGPKGTSVTLSVLRDKETGLRDISIIRDTITIHTVRHEMMRTLDEIPVGYIKITNFHEDTSFKFQETVNDLLSQGPQGFVIDVRNNGGGLLDKAVDISSYWVPSGHIIVQQKYSENNTEATLATGNDLLRSFPTIVLINGGSASGAEIFAGALKDHERAQLVGEKTFGKGSVQDLSEFNDGSAIKLTIAKWLTPNGTIIDKEGIVPDFEVELTEEDYNNDRDPQLDKALELLDEQLQNSNLGSLKKKLKL